MKSPMDKHFPIMEDMTVKSVRSYLQRKKSIIIPVGIIEQHGYHLPLNTDALIASYLARMIGVRTGILIAPTMHNSFSGGSCPGTINISPAVMSLLMSDMLTSMTSQGLKNFYLLLCHGGSENANALDNALQMLLRTHPAFRDVMIAVLPVWKLNSENVGWRKAVKEGDWHAGWLETSMVMALEPDKVQMEQLETDRHDILEKMKQHPDNYQFAQKIVDDEMVMARFQQQPEVKVGVMGNPEKATPEIGKQAIDDIVANAAEKITTLENKADGIYKDVEFNPPPLILK